MSFSRSLSSADKQNLTFSRRDLPRKLLAISAALLLPKPQPKFSHPSSKFNIGDVVAFDWIGEFGENFTDFGEIVGCRWFPEDYCIYPKGSWIYYINWTHSNASDDFKYPCHDGEPTTADRLRLVNYA